MNPPMNPQSLEEALQGSKSPVERLRNSQIGPYAFPVVRPEFTNWRDEQRSWKETCALLDQSHHMADLYVEGPDALKVLSDLGDKQLQEFQGQSSQAIRRLQPRRLCDWRRDPLLSGRKQIQPGRAPAAL